MIRGARKRGEVGREGGSERARDASRGEETGGAAEPRRTSPLVVIVASRVNDGGRAGDRVETRVPLSDPTARRMRINNNISLTYRTRGYLILPGDGTSVCRKGRRARDLGS